MKHILSLLLILLLSFSCQNEKKSMDSYLSPIESIMNRNSGNIRIYILYCLIVTFVLLQMGTLWALKKKQSDLLKREKEYAKLQEELKKALSKSDSLEKILLWKDKEIQKLNHEIGLWKIQRNELYEEFKHSDIYLYWKEMYAHDKTWHPKLCEIEELEIAFYSAYPFAASLNGLHLKLSSNDLRVCMLTILEFRPSFIASTLNVEPNAISMTKKRIYHKMTGHEGSAKDFDQYIKGLNNSQKCTFA